MPRSFVLGAFRTFSFLLSSVRLKLSSGLFQDNVKVFPIFRECGLINEALYKPRFTVLAKPVFYLHLVKWRELISNPYTTVRHADQNKPSILKKKKPSAPP
jgi:hypothetical protein